MPRANRYFLGFAAGRAFLSESPLSPVFRGRSLGETSLRDSDKNYMSSQRPLGTRAKRARDGFNLEVTVPSAQSVPENICVRPCPGNP